MTTWTDMTREEKLRESRARIREQMDEIGAADIAQIRASAITGGPACAKCGCNTVHGRIMLGRWLCRDTGTCETRTRRQVTRDLLHDRYHGVIPVTDAMIDAVITELPADPFAGIPDDLLGLED